MNKMYKRKEIIRNCTLYLGDCLEVMPTLDKVDSVLSDPPYMYLKHKLDKHFDRIEWINQVKNVTKDNASFSFFGRGVSLAQWIVEADNAGFKFKEEVVWDKKQSSSPYSVVQRVHELIVLFEKGNKPLNKIHINAFENIKNCNNYYKYEDDLKRIALSLRKIKSYDEFTEFMEGLYYPCKVKHNITGSPKENKDRGYRTFLKYESGSVLSSIMRVNREHYQFEHPTQKPIRLMENLIKLTTNEGDIVLDSFMGSGSTLVACAKTGRHGIGIELDEEYFNIACKRVEDAYRQGDLFI